MIDAPFGTWDSPISAEKASSSIVSFQDVAWDDNDLYWSEMRPTEGGRYVIVKQSSQGDPVDVLPPEFNARTRVHEYGGAAFMVYQGTIYFTNFQDQRLYKMEANQKPVAITNPGIRFGELKSTPFGIVAIAESHSETGKEPKNFLALISPQNGQIRELASGYDFYSSPALSRDFKHIAWICWNHPNMPWDDTQLWVADLDEKGLSHTRRIDAGTVQQSFFQPQWGPHNELIVVSDKSNWWNLYQVSGQSLQALFKVDSEIGLPLWTLGASTWGFYQDGIICAYSVDGKNQLFLFKNSKLAPMDLPFTTFSQIRTQNDKIAFIGGAADKPSAIVTFHDGKTTLLRKNSDVIIEEGYISKPVHVTFPSKDNREGYAFYYAPQNKRYKGIVGTKPPIIVKSHGGPTSHSGSNLNLDIQYWTSRGFAVVDVNYAGSSGYGREYRKRLEGNWGVDDVEDCKAAALYLVEKGLADKKKIAITGGSAGGFTTLAALAFTDTFQVGASLYGVSDLEALVKETHKFESRYLDTLIGPYPQDKQKYWDRSPIYHLEHFLAPIIFFQGDEDKIVPPDQAQMMYDALIKKGIKTKYVLFKGEQHGFRKAENRIRVLEDQRSFFVDVLKLNEK